MGLDSYENPHIESDTTFAEPKTFCTDLFIHSGATLTVKSTIKMAEKCRIVVHPGGKLIVDGGKITKACDDRMWAGVLVLGQRDKPQLEQYQGSVVLNNATIEHAILAVSAAYTGYYNQNGGIIKATNTTFKNNLRAIEYCSYDNYHPDLDAVLDNVGKFDRCTFVIDNNNLFSTIGRTFQHHVTMWQVKGVKFIGCKFENQAGRAGRGIYSFDAGYTIKPYCTAIIAVPGGKDCPCAESGKIPALFQNFSTGIYSNNSGIPYQIYIDQSNFNNNYIAMNIWSSDNYRLTRTKFTNIRYYGLQSYNSSGYQIEENSFKSYARMYSGVTGTTGIEIHDSGAADNRIYKNDFNEMYVAISAQGNNSNSTTNCSGSKDVYKPPISETIPRGLQFVCNNFDYNNYDLGIEAYSTVRRVQGSLTKGADNIFTRTIDNDLYIGNTQKITYYHSPGGNRAPIKAHLNSCSTINNNAAASDCASSFCIKTGLETKDSGEPDIEKYKIMQEEYDLLAAEYEKNEYGYVLANPDEYPKEVVAAAMECLQKLLELSEMMYAMSTDAVHTILGDSVLHTKQLTAWYEVIRTPIAKYLLAEAYAFTKEYEKAESVLKNMPELFKFGETEKKEHDNYLRFFNFKKEMTLSGRNWPELKEDEVTALENIAQATCGRSATMAQGVLCFFFDICKEYEDCRPKEVMNPKIAEAETESSLPENLKEEISIRPNPTTGELIVEMHGRASQKLSTIQLFDIFGKKVFETRESVFNINHLSEGVYIVKITLENGELVTRKVVKN